MIIFESPFVSLNSFCNEYKIIGYPQKHDEIYIDGEMGGADFLVWYGLNDKIVGVVGGEKRNKDLCVINEGIRLNMLPQLSQIVSQSFNIQDIKNNIKHSQRSGCFRDLIYQARFKYNIKDVIWVKRDVKADYYDSLSKGYQNFTANQPTAS